MAGDRTSRQRCRRGCRWARARTAAAGSTTSSAIAPDYGKVTLLYGARTPADLLFTTEYDAWKAANIDVQPMVNAASPDWHGAIGFVTALAAMPLDAANTAVLTCGPDVMMRFVGEGALHRGVPAEQVFVSLERNMNCAIGLCGHCQFGPDFVCKDGPVFSFDRVRRLMLVENF
ncbi:MAG: hypothetical protein U0792_10530 [Gemmataceae bacterium]